MNNILAIFLLFTFSISSHGQIPKNGTYEYKIAFAESPNMRNSKAECKVIIHGNKIKVIYIGNNLSGAKKGDIIDEGLILKHKSGKWIIGQKETDEELEEIGGCTDGPREIDFESKTFWMC